MVRQRFLVYTLPIVVGQHWRQLEPILKQMSLRKNMIPSLGVSLARAYRNYPTDILEFLQSWQSEAQSIPIHADSETVGQREGILATTALTYGYLPYYSDIWPQTIRESVNKFKAICDYTGVK